MPLRLALFDMDDVLCDYRVDLRIAALARIAGLPEERIRRAIWDSDYFDEADQGRYDAQGSLAEFGRRIGYPYTRDEWIAARRVAMIPRPDVLRLVERVRARAAIGVLTNNDELLAETIDDLFPELRPLFGANIFVSARFRTAKPDPEVYRACCAALSVAPGEAFFTDDKEENVEGARRAGLTGHVFRTIDGLEDALREAGLL